tara:strand:- start:346 stop:603 length:258 start_codon:yes stop_codon:yes gene_type:complete
MDTLIEVLKWVGIVLTIGFIGYFGRYLAMLIIEKMRKKEPQPPPTPQPAQEIPPSSETQLEESRIKLEKKKAKTKVKKAKKAQNR